MNVYDDYPPAGAPVVHLCPECRELMSDAVQMWRQIPTPPTEPDWSRALRWLDGLCGGREEVLALDVSPLTEPPPVPGELAAISDLLDAVAQEFFDDEVRVALRRGLVRAWERSPGSVVTSRPAPQVALGVVWAIGHANSLLHPRGAVTEQRLRAHLGATQSGSTCGQRIQNALQGPFDWDYAPRPWNYGYSASRGLKVLGHSDLLLSGTRQMLVEVRDRALAESLREPEEPFYRAG